MQIRMNPEALISRVTSLPATTLDDEVVLMSIERGSYYGLKGTAKRIWALLETPKTFADLSALLALEYEASANVIAQDLDSFVKKMVDAGIVTLS